MEKDNPAGFTPAMTEYAFGLSHQYPNVQEISKKYRDKMNELRRNFLRTCLKDDPSSAYSLPDFHFQLSKEISQYCKRELKKEVFAKWDEVVREAPRFFEHFNRVSAALAREYQDAVQQNRPYIKHRYLSITAKRRAFAEAVKSPKMIGELELACWGELRYGSL